jgi:lipopolysaccharide export system protein LptC
MSRVTGAQWVGRETAALSSGPGETHMAGAFAAARRHSRVVGLLRAALLLSGVAAVVALTAMGLYRTFGSALGRLSVGGVSIDGSKIVMDRPRLTGARQDGRSYVITAAKAIQDVKHPTLVDLVDIDGDIDTADRDPVHLTAAAGRYDTEHEGLDLSGVVHIHNNQYTIDLHSAHIDFKSGAYKTQEPLTVVTNSGSSIVADSALVFDNGKQVEFEGHVKSIIRSNYAESHPAQVVKGAEP